MSKGILGVKKDPKNQMLFFFGKKSDDQWPSDSDDSDYLPSDCSDEGKKLSKRSPQKRKKSMKGKELAIKRSKSQSSEKSRSGSKITETKTIKKPSVLKTARKHFRRILDCDSSDEGDRLTMKSGSTRSGDIWGQMLPDLVLYKIFKDVVADEGALPFLKRMSQVCRLWNHVAKNSLLWTRIDLSFGWIKKNETTLSQLCDTRFSHAVEINFSGWTCLNDHALTLVVDNCPKLTSLNLDGCRITGTGLNYLTDHCQNLCDISLTQTRLDLWKWRPCLRISDFVTFVLQSFRTGISSAPVDSSVGHKALKYLLEKRANDLVSLSLTENPLRRGTDLIKHILNCSKLERLSLCSLQYPSEPIVLPIEKFQTACLRLKRLELVSCSCSVSSVSAMQQAESPGFPNLEELNLGVSQDNSQQCVLTSDTRNNFLNRLLKKSQNLKVLDLRGRGSILCNSIPHLSISGLQRLYLSNSSVARYEGLDVMMKRWKHSLIEVDLSWNTYDEESFRRAMTQLSDASSESKLKVLDLRGTQVSPRQVRKLLSGCPSLESLNLESCRSLPRGMKRNYLRHEMQQLSRDIEEFISEAK